MTTDKAETGMVGNGNQFAEGTLGTKGTPLTDAAKFSYKGCIVASGEPVIYEGEAVPVDVTRDIERRLTAATALVDSQREQYRRVVDDVFDGMECDRQCDSYGHTETCCATNGPAAVAKLRALVATEKERANSLRANQTIIVSNYERAVELWGQRAKSAEAALRSERERADKAEQARNHAWKSIDDAELVAEEYGRPEGEYLATSIRAIVLSERELVKELRWALTLSDDLLFDLWDNDPAMVVRFTNARVRNGAALARSSSTSGTASE